MKILKICANARTVNAAPRPANAIHASVTSAIAKLEETFVPMAISNVRIVNVVRTPVNANNASVKNVTAKTVEKFVERTIANAKIVPVGHNLVSQFSLNSI